MNVNSNSIFKFVQLYVNAINISKQDNRPIKELYLYSAIENYFGREYLRFYVDETVRYVRDDEEKVFRRCIVHGDGGYYSYLVKNKHERLYNYDKNSENWEFYHKEYTKVFHQYHDDVTFFVNVIMTAFPDIKIYNNLKRYKAPDCWANEYLKEERDCDDWYEESLFFINYVKNNNEVTKLSEGVVYSNGYYIKPCDELRKEVEQKEQELLIKKKEEKEQKIKKEIQSKKIDTEIEEYFNERKKNTLGDILHEKTKGLM